MPLMAVDLFDGSAITVTVTHAFWVDEGPSRASWLEAGQIRVGDRLREREGTEAVVARLRYNVGQGVVYTLTVAKDHAFFVGTAQVLVHNAIWREVTSNFKLTGARANEVLIRRDASTGQILHYAVYDEHGNILYHVDLVGLAHADVPMCRRRTFTPAT